MNTTVGSALAANALALSKNVYPGRGIVMGMDETGKFAVQLYWIMGRSGNSRNRVFGCEGGRLFTEAADPTKVTDPSLIIYNAMMEGDGHFVVSNGHQTNDVYEGLRRGNTLESIHRRLKYEPDEPNFTPRITGAFRKGQKNAFQLSLVRKSAWDDSSKRSIFAYERIPAGVGFCVTTYTGDGSPLPPFQGEPLIMPLVGDQDAIAQRYWQALNGENRVSLAVKFIPGPAGLSSYTKVINRFTKVAQ